jgi:hypothetical protein
LSHIFSFSYFWDRVLSIKFLARLSWILILLFILSR